MSNQARIAIVTGSSRGIGRDIVLRLAERGVASVVTYNARRDEAGKVVTAVAEAGAAAVALRLDVGRPATFDAFVAEAREVLATLGGERFDYLVNNAGTSSTANLANGTEEELDALFAVHFKGPFLLTQKLLPLMNDGGRIVNVSSGLARFSFPNRTVYGPMKAAVEALTRYMALELGPRGITVNVVAPGAIATDFSGGATRDNPEVNRAIASGTALGRVGGPDEVGPVVAAMLSDDLRFVNGQRIEVSGGFRL